ncbi:MAG: UDP-N-acetylmuramate--L-alanine ligase, partial [bacterium]
NGDLIKARSLNLPILKRAEILARLFNEYYGIAIAGTSGKSTITAMVGHILTRAGLDPTVVNGAPMKNFLLNGQPNNIHTGLSNMMVIESDESDGSIIHYRPALSLIHTISKDHQEIPELLKLFQIFAGHTREKVIINADCPYAGSLTLKASGITTYSLEKDSSYRAQLLHLEPFDSTFECRGQRFHLSVPGIYNVSNALASLVIAAHLGLSWSDIQSGLETFQGISRRFELVGEARGIRVIDDFAHNPQKITAALRAASGTGSRRILVFQPHGYGPIRFLKEELAEAFASEMSDHDILFIPEVYYAGGTASRDISSRDLVNSITKRGRDARYGESRESLLKSLIEESRSGDTILVMGARDDTITSFCRKILHRLEEET